MYTKSNSPWLNDSKLPYRQLLSCLKFINTVRNWLHFLKYKYDTGIPVLKISDLSSGINLQLKGRAFHSRKNIPLVFNKHYYKLIQKVTTTKIHHIMLPVLRHHSQYCWIVLVHELEKITSFMVAFGKSGSQTRMPAAPQQSQRARVRWGFLAQGLPGTHTQK